MNSVLGLPTLHDAKQNRIMQACERIVRLHNFDLCRVDLVCRPDNSTPEWALRDLIGAFSHQEVTYTYLHTYTDCTGHLRSGRGPSGHVGFFRPDMSHVRHDMGPVRPHIGPIGSYTDPLRPCEGSDAWPVPTQPSHALYGNWLHLRY